jgi:hypothetical protein
MSTTPGDLESPAPALRRDGHDFNATIVALGTFCRELPRQGLLVARFCPSQPEPTDVG